MIARTGIEVTVTGAQEAEAALRGVAKADAEVAVSAVSAGKAIADQERAVRTSTNAFGTAIQTIQRYDHATGLLITEQVKVAKSSTEAAASTARLRAEINAVAQPANGMRVALEGAGKTLTFLQRAAAILPGFGIAGLLLEIGRAAEWLAGKFVGAEQSTRLQTAALAEQKRIIEETTKAVYELGRAQAEAGRQSIGGALGIDPRTLSGGLRIEGAQLESERARLTARQRELDARAGEIAASERSVRERAARLSESAAGGIRPGMYGTAAALEAEAAQVGKARAAFDAEARKMQDAEFELARRVGDLQRRAGVSAPVKANGRTAAAKMPTAAGPGIRPTWAPGIAEGEDLSPFGVESVIAIADARAKRDADAFARLDRSIEEMRAVELQKSKDLADAMQEFGKPAAVAEPLMNALDMMAASFEGTFNNMVSTATNAAGLMVSAFGAIAGAAGQMATNMIISGEAGAKGAAKAAGNAIAGLSAQAFGFGVMLEGLALASALVPFLGFSAPSIAAAGAVMFGVGGALALTARALGADKLGAKGAGSRAGGGGGTVSAAGTGSAGQPMQQTQVINITLGGQVLTTVLNAETRRQSLRGGIMVSA